MSPEIEAYLEQLGFQNNRSPDLEFLSALQRRHLETIPFENLSVVWKQPVVLDLPRLQEKIIGRKRGGFCYELNSLFHELLRALGFDVKMISARVYSPLDGKVGLEFDHLALVVRLDQEYLVDVGFGDANHAPIALPSGESVDASGRYRIQSPQDDGRFHLQREAPEGWSSLYDFTPEPRQLSDFEDMCVYHQTSPESIFAIWKICTRLTPDGRVTLMRDALILTGSNGKEKQAIASEEAYHQALRDYFGIEPPSEAEKSGTA